MALPSLLLEKLPDGTPHSQRLTPGPAHSSLWALPSKLLIISQYPRSDAHSSKSLPPLVLSRGRCWLSPDHREARVPSHKCFLHGRGWLHCYTFCSQQGQGWRCSDESIDTQVY